MKSIFPTLGAIIEASATSCILHQHELHQDKTRDGNAHYNECEVHDTLSKNVEISCPWHAKKFLNCGVPSLVDLTDGTRTILFWRQLMKYTSDFVSPWTWVCTIVIVELVHWIRNHKIYIFLYGYIFSIL